MLEIEGGEVRFADFAEAEGVGDEAFASFDFDEVFAELPAILEGEANGVFVVVGLFLFTHSRAFLHSAFFSSQNKNWNYSACF